MSTSKTMVMEVQVEPTEILKQPYARILTPDPDGRFTAEIMEFPGCVAFGDNPAHALSNLEEVAIDWIAAAIEQGQDIPKPMDAADFSGKLVLRMTKGLHRKAALCADREGVSLNQFIVTCLAEAVGERAKPFGIGFHPQVQATATFSFQGAAGGGSMTAVAMNVGNVQRGLISAPSSNQIVTFPIQKEREREYA
jgi:predicted RNase H-like HicB family nuclease